MRRIRTHVPGTPEVKGTAEVADHWRNRYGILAQMPFPRHVPRHHPAAGCGGARSPRTSPSSRRRRCSPLRTALVGVAAIRRLLPRACTHVWNYAQAIPPSLPRPRATPARLSSTRARPRVGTRRSGRFAHPRDQDRGWPASDGQLGGIMKVYREWRVGRHRVVETIWPLVKQSSTTV